MTPDPDLLNQPPTLEILGDLCSFYGIGDPVDWAPWGTESPKLNGVISTAGAKYFLKDYSHGSLRSPAKAEWVYRIISHLASCSIPVVSPLLPLNGSPWFSTEDRLLMLFPLVRGIHLDGPDMNRDQASHLGSQVARLHRSLAAFDIETVTLQPSPPPPLGDPHGSWIRRLESSIPHDDPCLSVARRHFALIDQVAPEVTLTRNLSSLVLHSDLTPFNVLWGRELIVAFLDWDDFLVGPRIYDIAHLMNWFFWNDPIVDWEKIARFLTAYHGEYPLSGDEIESLVDFYFYCLTIDMFPYRMYLETGHANFIALAHESYENLGWVARHRADLNQHVRATLRRGETF